MTRLRGALLCIALVAGSVTATGSSASGAVRDRIAFSRGGDIYTVHPDGSGLKRVTDHPAFEQAVWSPDGDKLAVTRLVCSASSCRSWISVMNPDGSQPVRVTGRVVGWVRAATWSPLGTEIAFVDWIDGNESPNPSAIKVAQADGSGQQRLTGFAGWNFSPSWSPDGTQLAFESYRDGDDEIYVMNRDGSQLRPLTGNDLDDMGPAWSPDGTAIAFTTREAADDLDEEPAFSYPEQAINLVAPDGTESTEVVQAAAMNWFSSWSPDGRRLLFRRTQFDDDGQLVGEMLMTVPVDAGEAPTELGLAGYSSTWSPDGSEVAFERDGSLYVVPSSGGDPVRITRNAQDSEPHWRPR